MTIYIAVNNLNTTENKTVAVLQLVGGIYILIRGLDNVEKGLDNVEKGLEESNLSRKIWNKWFNKDIVGTQMIIFLMQALSLYLIQYNAYIGMFVLLIVIGISSLLISRIETRRMAK
jgi:hypothetical protein